MGEPVTASHPGSRDLMPDPEASARRAGLRYVNDDEPGIRRKKWGRGFTYLDPEGHHVKDDELRDRIEALSIPPAWTDVWICPHENGHLQATGRDDEGRKQYVYHPAWRDVRNRAKFDRLIPFAESLPEIRAHCLDDLDQDGLSREKVLATVVRLLDRTLMRIGHSQYAQHNDSYGLTTLRSQHVSFTDEGCTFEYIGKGDKEHSFELHDPALARVIEHCCQKSDAPLFQYYDDENQRHDVDSEAVNDYLQTAAELPVTAKDFRTWGGTVAAAVALGKFGSAETKQDAQQNVSQMTEEVAEQLGNTKAVCRDHYIHPDLIEAYRDGGFLPIWRKHVERASQPHFSSEEHATLETLRTLRNEGRS